MEAIKTDVHVEPTTETPWEANADALAAWAIERMVNRDDARGEYTNGQALTSKTPITPAILESHFRGETVCGLHAISRDNTCKWMCFDIDCHGKDDDPKATERYSQFLRRELEGLGLEPTLFSNDGRGSYHLMVFFEEPIAAEIVFAFGRKFLREFKPPEGVAPEFFPKQPRIAENGFGSWLRAPGRHHKRTDHWHKAFVGNHWLNAEGTPRHILSINGIDPERIRSYVGKFPPPEGTRNNELFNEACDLKGRGLSQDVAVSELSPRFLEAGLNRSEIEGTISSAFSKPRTPVADKASDNGTMERHAVLRSATEIRIKPLKWLWPGRIPGNKLTVIAGEPGLGTSLLAIYLAAITSSGGAWPDDLLTLSEPGNVILVSGEDDYDDGVIPRLVAAGYDPTRTTVFDGVAWKDRNDGDAGESLFRLDQHVRVLARAIETIGGCLLIVIDPVSAFLGKIDSHNNAEVRSLLHPLSNLAAQYACAVVCVTHLNKGVGSAINRVQGSGAFTAAPRAAWQVTRDPADESRRLFLPTKMNYARDAERGLAFRITTKWVEGYGDAALVDWEDGDVITTANAALRERSDVDDVADWLRRLLKAGPKPASDVFDSGINGEGFTRATINRAKRPAGVEAVKRKGYQGGWDWRIKGTLSQ